MARPGNAIVAGILEYSNIADSAAKDALDGDISVELIPFSDLKSCTICLIFLLELWQSEWDEFPWNKLYKILPQLKDCIICPQTNRREETVISGLHVVFVRVSRQGSSHTVVLPLLHGEANLCLHALSHHVGLQGTYLFFLYFVKRCSSSVALWRDICMPSLTMLDYKVCISSSLTLWRHSSAVVLWRDICMPSLSTLDSKVHTSSSHTLWKDVLHLLLCGETSACPLSPCWTTRYVSLLPVPCEKTFFIYCFVERHPHAVSHHVGLQGT